MELFAILSLSGEKVHSFHPSLKSATLKLRVMYSGHLFYFPSIHSPFVHVDLPLRETNSPSLSFQVCPVELSGMIKMVDTV